MSRFFKATLTARWYQNKTNYPLLKLGDLLDWQLMGNKLDLARTSSPADRWGHQGDHPLNMFKAVLLGQWHNLSDPALEHGLSVRADFLVFCDFDDMDLPDHSTLCRHRQWLMKGDWLKHLMADINHQLEPQHLKMNHANVAIVDASIIESIGASKRKVLEVDENGAVTQKVTLRGYSPHWSPCAWKPPPGCLAWGSLKGGMMHKAAWGRRIPAAKQQRNHQINSERWVIEQTFGTLKRRFQFRQANYFGQNKVLDQCYLKAMGLNLLKSQQQGHLCLMIVGEIRLKNGIFTKPAKILTWIRWKCLQMKISIKIEKI
jgi:transposase, IS5 family